MSTKLNWFPVKSSQIKRIAHDAETKTAIVHFTNGGIYEYAEFPPEKFELFKASDSVGKFLGTQIKGKHPFKKVTDPAQLIELMAEEKPHIENVLDWSKDGLKTNPEFNVESKKTLNRLEELPSTGKFIAKRN